MVPRGQHDPSASPLVMDRWAVGDAAGTANLLGGEGIRHAIDSASVLGDCLLSGGSHRDYQAALRQRFGWRWTVSNRLHGAPGGA